MADSGGLSRRSAVPVQNSKSSLSTILGGLAVVAVIALLVFFFGGSRSQQQQTQTSSALSADVSSLRTHPAPIRQRPLELPRLCDWEDLKGKFKGQRAFLIGNGPSINRLPLQLLLNEYTFTFNRFYLMEERLNWYPTFYCVVDTRVVADIGDEVSDWTEKVMGYGFFPVWHDASKTDYTKYVRDGPNVCWYKKQYSFGWHQPPKVGQGGTVAFVGLQALAYMGFSPIYVIGLDMSYGMPASTVKESRVDYTSKANDDINHFDPRYFGTNREWHEPKVDKDMIPSMKLAREEIEKKGGVVYNAGHGGRLEAFDRIEFQSLFKDMYTEEQQLWILLDAIQKKADFLVPIDHSKSTLPEVLPTACVGATEEAFTGCTERVEELIVVESDLVSAEGLRKMVFKYKQFGPHLGRYVFTKRPVPLSEV